MPQTLQEYFRDAWRRRCGLPPVATAERMPDLPELERSEWSDEFERLQRTRLVMGAFRYGRLGDPRKPSWDRCTALHQRLERYAATGNVEMLVDVANMAMLEYVEGRHPQRHLACDHDVEHVEEQSCER